NRIKINQLWVPAAMLLEEATLDQQSDEFVILRQEARYRLLEGEDILGVLSTPKANGLVGAEIEGERSTGKCA
ncbi:MAG TPA: hypothetical protein VGP12_07580, partial [Nitrosospira sp.]|nr:hypothetical protein [Nitrosospira sp.]